MKNIWNYNLSIVNKLLQASKLNISKDGLLGTKHTMEQEFYKSRLNDYGVEVLIPDREDREYINNVIFHELCLGETKPNPNRNL